MSGNRVGYEQHEGVGIVRMDDGKVNALSNDMLGELQAALDRAEKEATALVLTGREERLSGGFDLKVMQQGAEAARDMVRGGAELALRMAEFPVPVVVACNGHAIAMGAILLCAADLRIGVAGDFKIGLNEVAIGLTLPTFGVEFARQRLSKRHFHRAATLAELYDPAGALDAGFLDRTVPAADLQVQALAAAQTLSQLPSQAFRGTRARVYADSLAAIRRSLDVEFAS